MRCDGIMCKEDATVTRDIQQADGSTRPWNLCAKHNAAFDIELADRLAHNAAEAAEHDRWLDRLYPKAS